jgi:hypothetical protein
MVFRFKERPKSRNSTREPASLTLEYVAAGSTDDAFVRAYALAGSPAVVSTGDGTLYRQDLAVDWQGSDIAYIRVPYAKKKQENGQFRLSFDTTGGSVTIKCAKEHVATYPGSAKNHRGAINVNGKEVEGTEIVIPALKLTGHFTHPAGIITIPQIKNLARLTGKTNSDNFLTFEPGEVLFLGCSGSEGTDSPTEIGYQFACSENLQSLVIAGISVAQKRGWDVIWFEFHSEEDDGHPIRPPKAIHVERVYESVPLALSLGFGG